MPSKSRKHPANLAAKLLKIRNDLRLSQSEMVRKLNVGDEIDRAKISEYESGRRLPGLHILLAYAKTANRSTDYLIDDDIEI